ncbi:hypothetical protein VMCG_00163 [Cytospora schulzeri]|uniref:Uncharacterized protein n=1 Tax=Cytospora schulzeri TaxID=448051 RepID=A0A423X8G6_9PEZI|nr:hypothetical protein VMCG_00163 [Valsa malicola]
MAQPTVKAGPDEGRPELSPASVPHSRFIPRTGTQRHCDHLEGVKPIRTDHNERKIEREHVARFLKERVSSPDAHGYWEVYGQSSDETWVTLIRFKTFELLIQPPPGQTITLGNLDLAIILETCLEDTGDGPFVRKLSSTATCWPRGFARFRWMLRGTMSIKQRIQEVPLLRSQVSQGEDRQSLLQRASACLKKRLSTSSSYTTRSRQSTDVDGLPTIFREDETKVDRNSTEGEPAMPVKVTEGGVSLGDM